jgi:hypothetical protein
VYNAPLFEAMPKIARLNKDVIVTEKIDGTNAQIYIERVPVADIGFSTEAESQANPFPIPEEVVAVKMLSNGDHLLLRAGSKNRWLKPGADNFGFFAWASEHFEQLFTLGEGVHRGEWWGKGVQRGYGLTGKRFSLFNVSRWVDSTDPDGYRAPLGEGQSYAPACCHVVPIMGSGPGFEDIATGLYMLQQNGSLAAPGFMEPEGVCVFHTGSGTYYKATIENDLGKWAVQPANVPMMDLPVDPVPVAGETL